jgi:hypothetical protein
MSKLLMSPPNIRRQMLGIARFMLRRILVLGAPHQFHGLA